MSRHDITPERWLGAWQAFDTLYVPHDAQLQEVISQHAEAFEQAYASVDEAEEREAYIGQCYLWAKQHQLPLALVDWWRTLQVCWVEGEDNFAQLPDALPEQHSRFLHHQQPTLRAFRQALADDIESARFLASMLEAIRAAEAQRRMLQA